MAGTDGITPSFDKETQTTTAPTIALTMLSRPNCFVDTANWLSIGKTSREMEADVLCIAVFQPVVEPLVIAEIESLLLEFPLQVPICFGNKEEAGMLFLYCRYHIRPIFSRESRASAASPRALENGVQEKHCHVTTHPIALLGHV